jgi:2-keto-4-pentenoate hydratase
VQGIRGTATANAQAAVRFAVTIRHCSSSIPTSTAAAAAALQGS